MRWKDIVGLMLLSTLLFPLILVLILLSQGVIRIDVGGDPTVANEVKGYVEKVLPEDTATAGQDLPDLAANQKTLEQIRLEKEAIAKEQERMEQVRQENERLVKEAEILQSQYKQNASEDMALLEERLQGLAQVYGAMKPVEAAPILLNMPNDRIAQILGRVPEERQKAKLLAALGNLDKARAAEVSKILGFDGNTPMPVTPPKK
jgi:flagellar motility protein MotE (MotC chaperone)